MPKGVEAGQLQNAGIGRNLSSNLIAQGENNYGSLEPALAASAYAPSGYTPGQKSLMNTAAQQSAGGTNAGAVGSGGLLAARTRNAGAAGTAIGSASRGAGADLSRAATGTEVQSANLAQKNRQEALGGLGELYSGDTKAGLGALGESNTALEGAGKSSADNPWHQILLQAMQDASNLGAAKLAAG